MALKSRAVQEDIHIITVAFILLSVSLDQANANMDTNINPNNIFQQNTTDYSMATEDSTILQSKQKTQQPCNPNKKKTRRQFNTNRLKNMFTSDARSSSITRA
eukprot:192175_1